MSSIKREGALEIGVSRNPVVVLPFSDTREEHREELARAAVRPRRIVLPGGVLVHISPDPPKGRFPYAAEVRPSKTVRKDVSPTEQAAMAEVGKILVSGKKLKTSIETNQKETQRLRHVTRDNLKRSRAILDTL